MDSPQIVMPRPGDVIGGRYHLVGEIGRGAYGIIFRAKQAGLDEDVAVKVVRPHVLENDSLRTRFQREIQLAKQLRHPNTVRILDVSEVSAPLPYYVMELLEGQTLAQLLETDGAMSSARACHIGVQVLKGLGEAHSKGVVHRDLKPENIFLCTIFGERDYVKILDFGIARAFIGTPSTLTVEKVLGTPFYMSPEQSAGRKDLDGRSDLYAVALIMAECLTGERIVRGQSALHILAIQRAPERLQLPPEVASSPLAPALQCALEKNRDFRFPTAQHMIEALIGPAPRHLR